MQKKQTVLVGIFLLLLLLVIAMVVYLKNPDVGFKKEWTLEQAPETFIAQFETTKGDFQMQIIRNWSPHAADRFYQLVKHGYFNNGIFYRVVPGFVAQFGNSDTQIMQKWRTVKVPDEAIKHRNEMGTVSFARYGKETRDLELFINLDHNTVLDTLGFEGVKGFPPIGKVIKGMEVVYQLYSGYGETTMADGNLYTNRTLFYQTFPKLDLIKKAYIVP